MRPLIYHFLDPYLIQILVEHSADIYIIADAVRRLHILTRSNKGVNRSHDGPQMFQLCNGSPLWYQRVEKKNAPPSFTTHSRSTVTARGFGLPVDRSIDQLNRRHVPIEHVNTISMFPGRSLEVLALGTRDTEYRLREHRPLPRIKVPLHLRSMRDTNASWTGPRRFKSEKSMKNE